MFYRITYQCCPDRFTAVTNAVQGVCESCDRETTIVDIGDGRRCISCLQVNHKPWCCNGPPDVAGTGPTVEVLIGK